VKIFDIQPASFLTGSVFEHYRLSRTNTPSTH
jgi:hypothetical protein